MQVNMGIVGVKNTTVTVFMTERDLVAIGEAIHHNAAPNIREAREKQLSFAIARRRLSEQGATETTFFPVA